jgi:hypothetical protein
MCQHYKRRYLLQKGVDGAIQFECETCGKRVSLPVTVKVPTWSLMDLYPCECTQFGLPTFSRSERERELFHDETKVSTRHVLSCLRCQYTQISLPESKEKDQLPYCSLLTTGKWGKELRRRRVTSLKQLFPSDQLIVVGKLYEHHAMIFLLPVQVEDKFTVIHYVPTSVANPGRVSSFSTASKRYEARMDEYSFEKYKDQLMKVEYLPLDVNPPEQSVNRAYDALGEVFYRLLQNNCEHFVRRIKADESISQQVARRLPWLHQH